MNICVDIEVDAWVDEVITNKKGVVDLEDLFIGKLKIKNVTEKKYLGDIVSDDLRNDKNIKDKTNKAVGNVNKILNSLSERPYGRHS